jgi:hypothetical protein
MSTFDSASRLLANCVGMTSIGLSQSEESVDRLLICTNVSESLPARELQTYNQGVPESR